MTKMDQKMDIGQNQVMISGFYIKQFFVEHIKMDLEQVLGKFININYLIKNLRKKEEEIMMRMEESMEYGQMSALIFIGQRINYNFQE
ncbi:unnamed protein product [Paramecium primaurelia]|uniref:Uncharacterized protein n=1 Tax=Paramecium primaurelia TaxID=5886 RepID=A0A8S1LK82_PARPR|nr:unnamed protein product [Paramecium primaurelia]